MSDEVVEELAEEVLGEVVPWDNAAANVELTDEILERPDDLAEDGEELELKQEILSPTVLRLDEWSVRKGREVFDQSDIVKKSYGDFLKSDDLNDLVNMTADFHSASFEPVSELTTKPKNVQLSKYMEALFSTPEFQSLHADTVLDEEMSELATAAFVNGFCKHRVVVATEGEAEGMAGEVARMKAAAEACSGACAEVEQWRDMKQTFGLGGEGSSSFTKMPTAEIRKRFSKIRSNKRLQRICQLAGRYRRMAQACQRRKATHGRDEHAGVSLGGEIESLLPSELSLLANPDTELIVMRRIVERTAMIREFRKIEKVAKGPIVVVVDESGSMNGEPIACAKAIALSLYWIARHQKRWICLVGFSGGTEGNFLPIGTDENRMDELMEWLEHFYSGGTTLDVPLDVLPKRWAEFGLPKGKTDVVMITDACVSVPEKLEKSFLVWKKEQEAKCQVIVIGDEPGDLTKVCDSCFRVSDLGIEQEAVGSVLSI